MFVVALTSLKTPIDVEATALATDLGITAYESRLMMAAGFPAMVLTTASRAKAVDLFQKIRARGHGSLVCDDAEVVRSNRMRLIRRFRFEPAVLVTDVPPSGEDSLPYDDVSAILRAMHQRSSVAVSEVAEKKLAVGRAIATGGLMMTKSTTREIVKSNEDREQVLYLFRKSGQTPWILFEGAAQYSGLGPDLGPTRAMNFITTMERLKVGCTTAVFDDRLMTARRLTERAASTAKTTESSSADGVDLLAHLLALSVAHAATSPYRG